jgi:LEA14-like dessication related protein
MRRRAWLWGSVLALLVLGGGCAGLGKYREPVRVTVSDIRVLETTMLEQLYAVTLRIQNPNEHPLAVRGGSFDLEINGRSFGSGVSDAAVTVPPFSDAKIEVRMVSTLFGMLRLIQSFQERERQSLEYDISGRLSVEQSFTGLSFRERGELSLPKGAAPRAVP